MAILQMFPGVVPASDLARARNDRAAQMRDAFLSDAFRGEIYGPLAEFQPGAKKPTDLMPAPDEVRFGLNEKIYQDMASNVLRYGAEVEKLIDMMTCLTISWLPGMKGDAESEQAAAEIQAAWELDDERANAVRAWYRGLERGFSGVENIWDQVSGGILQDFITPVARIDHPVGWFGFNYRKRPVFMPRYQTWVPSSTEVEEFKVAFLRCGSTHTPRGHGYGQDCYPTVWAIDTAMKRFAEGLERFGFLPAIVTYPMKWGTGARYSALVRSVRANWPNALFVPGDVDEVKTVVETGSAYAQANAVGASLMTYVAKLEEWLGLRIQGSVPSAANAPVGSFARDAVASTDRGYKAPYYAACLEATLNRGFVRPCMMVNRPQLAEHKWPRASIDAAFGSDLQIRLQIIEAAVKLGFKVSDVTFSDEFKLPIAQPGDVVLEAPRATNLLPAADPNADPAANPFDASARPSAFGEQGIVKVRAKDGRVIQFFAESLVYTANRGTVRASELEAGDIPEATDRLAS